VKKRGSDRPIQKSEGLAVQRGGDEGKRDGVDEGEGGLSVLVARGHYISGPTAQVLE